MVEVHARDEHAGQVITKSSDGLSTMSGDRTVHDVLGLHTTPCDYTLDREMPAILCFLAAGAAAVSGRRRGTPLPARPAGGRRPHTGPGRRAGRPASADPQRPDRAARVICAPQESIPIWSSRAIATCETGSSRPTRSWLACARSATGDPPTDPRSRKPRALATRCGWRSNRRGSSRPRSTLAWTRSAGMPVST